MSDGLREVSVWHHAPGPAVRLNRHQRERYLADLREGGEPVLAARRCGTNIDVIEHARRVDPVFARDEEIARAEALAAVAEVAYGQARKGKKDFTLPYLAAHDPGRWRGALPNSDTSVQVGVAAVTSVPVPDARAAAAEVIAGLLGDGDAFVWQGPAIEAGSVEVPEPPA